MRKFHKKKSSVAIFHVADMVMSSSDPAISFHHIDAIESEKYIFLGL